MNYLVLCVVNLAITWNGAPNSANVELKGYEVKELGHKYSMVDFTVSLKSLPYAYSGNKVIKVEMNNCRYLNKEDVARFNSL